MNLSREKRVYAGKEKRKRSEKSSREKNLENPVESGYEPRKVYETKE